MVLQLIYTYDSVLCSGMKKYRTIGSRMCRWCTKSCWYKLLYKAIYNSKEWKESRLRTKK